MNDTETDETADTVEVLDALHCALSTDLEDLETQIAALDSGRCELSATDAHAIAQYRNARTALHSGLASIAEVLGWIEWKTEQEPDGAIAIAVQALWTSRGYLIH
jgi:phage shock protein A